MVKLFSMDERIKYFKLYGSHCIAYSTLQPGMKYFDLPAVGYIAYMEKGGTRFVLGDPICSQENMQRLIAAALKEYKKTSFYQVSAATARLLHTKFGFYMNIFGTETNIYKQELEKKEAQSENENHIALLQQEELALTNQKDELYSKMTSSPELKKQFWAVKKKVQSLRAKIAALKDEKKMNDSLLVNYLKKPSSSHVRRQYNLALDGGVKIFLEDIRSCNPQEILAISREWVSTRMVSSKEMSFFTRPLTLKFDLDKEVKLFIARNKNNEAVGFLILDPIYQFNSLTGFYADILRTKKNAPRGTVSLLILAAMDFVFEKGYGVFTLGLSPFHRMGKVHFAKQTNPKDKIRVDNKLMTLSFDLLFNYGNFLYNAKDQAFHKERFNGTMEHTFCCTKKKIPFKELLDAFLVSGINPVEQIF